MILTRNVTLPAGAAPDIIEYDEQLVRRLIEKITVYKDKFSVEFKSGVAVDMEE